MKIAILECTSRVSRHKAIDAHVRNSYYLSEIFGWDLLFEKEDYEKYWNRQYDRIIIMYGSFYAPVRYMKAFAEKNENAKLFWITNEYNIGVNSFLLKIPRGFEMISNVEKPTLKKNVLDFHSLNLNVLMWQDPNFRIPKKYDIIYYGTYRPDRSKYFKEYLQDGVYFSTSRKNIKKFKYIGCNPQFIGKLSWAYRKETLNLFKYSLYLEDEYTHRIYNHLANRFYEALFCNTITLFDSNCKNTIRRAGLNVPEIFLIDSYNDMLEKVSIIENDYEKYQKMQEKWNTGIHKQRNSVLNQIKNIIEG